MRRFGFLIALAVVFVAVVAEAGYVVTCTRNRDWLTVNGPYETVGQCPLPTQYVTGGMPFADPNAVSATVVQQSAWKNLCGTPARIPQLVLFEPSLVGPNAHAGLTFTYNPTTFKVYCNDPNTGAECASSANLSTITTRFYAVCK